MNNTRTVTLPVSGDFENGDTLLSAVSEFDGESRYWENVTITANDGDARVALGVPAEPADDASSVSILAGRSRTFASVNFENAWFRAGDSVESGSEEQGIEIVGTPASRPNKF